jgi:hypothetical protein
LHVFKGSTDAGTVCAVERDVSKDGAGDALMDSWPLAGDLKDFSGKNLDAKWESLSDSNSHAVSGKEGLRLSMYGGIHKVNDEKRPQKVIVEFLCDKSRVGDENLWIPEDKYGKKKRAEGDDTDTPKEDEPEDPAKEPSLKFLWYNTTGDMDILRLEWRTKYACLDAGDKEEPKPNGRWGFFTWFIIMYASQLHLTNSLLTFDIQCFPIDCDLSHLWLMAQL